MEKIKLLITSGNTNIGILLKNSSNNIGLSTEIGENVNMGSGDILIITGVTTSKLESVKTFNYAQPYSVGVNGVTEITSTYTAYTINNINYVTTSDSTSFSFSKKDDDFVSKNVIFEEAYLNQAFTPFLDNQINIERQTTSVMEVLGRFHLLKNVDSVGQYNNNFFNVSNQ